jgi:hypothetical protein
MAKHEVKIIRSRRRTLALQVTADGQVVARAPLLMPVGMIRRFVESKAAWIDAKVAQRKAQSAQAAPMLTAAERKALAKQAHSLIPPRVAYYAPLVGVTYHTLALRFQRTRWGSCSSRGNLNFNCLLVLVPAEVLDYVVVHELCHRKEMNHSPRFWAEVERLCPDWRVHRRWLREQGSALLQRL